MNNLRVVQDLYDAFGRKDEARLRELGVVPHSAPDSRPRSWKSA